jgi:hypothetical protein
VANSDHISVSVSLQSVGVGRAEFGIGGFISHTAVSHFNGGELSRTYGSEAEVATDGFATTSPEYLAAAQWFAQEPHPDQFMILSAPTKPTMKYELLASLANSTAYGLAVAGEGVTADDIEHTSSSAATLGEIHGGLIAQLNAVTGKNYTAAGPALVYADDTFTANASTEVMTNTTHGLLDCDGPFQLTTSGTLPAGLSLATDYWIIKIDADTFYFASSLANAAARTYVSITTAGTGTHTIADTVSTQRPATGITVTGSSAGAWFAIKPEASAVWAEFAITHVDPGVTADLVALKAYDSAFYILLSAFNSDAMVKAISSWAESNGVEYWVDTPDTDALNVAIGGGDLLDDLHDLARNRTLYSHYPDPSKFFSVAWASIFSAYPPGGVNPKFKSPSGCPAVAMTSTQRANLMAKKANSIETAFGVPCTFEGHVAGTYKFIDVVRNLDFAVNEVQSAQFEVLNGAPIVGMDDDGIGKQSGALRGSADLLVESKVAAKSPAPVVTAPRAADISAAKKAARALPNMKLSFTLVGAVNSVEVALAVTF